MAKGKGKRGENRLRPKSAKTSPQCVVMKKKEEKEEASSSKEGTSLAPTPLLPAPRVFISRHLSRSRARSLTLIQAPSLHRIPPPLCLSLLFLSTAPGADVVVVLAFNSLFNSGFDLI